MDEQIQAADGDAGRDREQRRGPRVVDDVEDDRRRRPAVDELRGLRLRGNGGDNYVRTVDRCLQLFGGYGYMLEYPIARAYVDSRVTTIYGGTTEIMKEIIGRSLGL